jgi:Ca2+-binding EF-hand superfamily protein
MSFVCKIVVVCKLVNSSAKVHPAYDHIAFSQVPKERFEELKKAFVLYDKDKSGKIKTTGIVGTM